MGDSDNGDDALKGLTRLDLDLILHIKFSIKFETHFQKGVVSCRECQQQRSNSLLWRKAVQPFRGLTEYTTCLSIVSPPRQRMNKMKPIWMRNPRDVKDEEYAEFYKSTFKAWDELAAHTHFSLEGQVEFRALLFVPSVLPYELSRNMFDETSRNMRLYVKRVFINDKFEELLPRWLMFLRGVVS